jgi:hypothetical protein
MPAPQAVIEQAEAAQKLHKQLYPDQYPQDTEQPAETPGTPVPVTPQAEATPPAPVGEQPPEEPPAQVEEPPIASVETPPAVEPPIVEAPVAVEGGPEELQKAYQKLLKSHEILQNKYNLGKHQEEYKTALEARDSRITNLESENAILKSQPVAPAPVVPPPVASVEITPDMKALFDEIKVDVGDDTADKLAKYFQLMATQVAQNMATQAISPIGQELTAVRQEIDGVRQKARESLNDDYVSDLTTLCPDWESIKVDPGFAEYLAGLDRGSGAVRYDLAENRMKAFDAEGVAHWYNDYKESIGLPTTIIPPVRKTNPPKKGKEALIVPVSSAKGAVPQAEKPIYSQAQLRGMEKQIIDLNRIGKIEEAKAIESTINFAIADRRIVP